MSLKISELYIYPIKSLMGIRLKSAKVEYRGLQYDRRWMLVDFKDRFISQRQHAEMVFLETSLQEDMLVITDRRTGKYYETPLHPQIYKDKLQVRVWDDEVQALEISSDANEWFSNALQREVKLVYMHDDSMRYINPEWSSEEEIVSFADGYPLLMVNEESLNALNEKLEIPVEMIRFRPNIVISGGQPYDEFYYKDLKIGDYEFRGLKPCARCNVTTINPATGISGKEPLLTLSRQKVDEKIVFGQHALVKDPAGAVIREGDEVVVISRKEAPYDRL